MSTVVPQSTAATTDLENTSCETLLVDTTELKYICTRMLAHEGSPGLNSIQTITLQPPVHRLARRPPWSPPPTAEPPGLHYPLSRAFSSLSPPWPAS